MDLVRKLESIEVEIREIAERIAGRIILTQLHDNRNEQGYVQRTDQEDYRPAI